MNVKLINYQGLEKDCPVGFSWTTLFFGFLVPLFRGDLVGVLIHLLASVFSIGIFWLIWPFFYNKNYINRLLEKGYMPYSDTGASTLRGIGIRVSQSYESRKRSEKEKDERSTSASSFAAVARETSTEALESSSGETFKKDGGSENKYDFDFTDRLSLAWPVSLMQGSLQKSTAVDGLERVSCTFSYQNVQSRQILYTQWELKCLDILKKPILSDNPIIIRNEYSIGPKGLATVKSSDVLPSGTRSFTPYLKAVLYEDQTVEEFSEENLVSLKPKTRAVEIEGSSESALEYYRQVHKLSEAPRFLYEKNEEGIWTCAFCGTRNGQDAVECRLCSVGMDQQELCSKEHIEQSDGLYQAHLEQVRKEREERERLEREEAERARKEREERERLEREREEQIRLERERIRKIKQRRIFVILVIIAAIIALGWLLWSFVLKPMNEYKAAQEYYEAGMYDKAYQTYEQLGDYNDSRELYLKAYADYLETESAEAFRIEGYQFLLESGYSRESMYELAGQKVGEGRPYEGYRIFGLLGDYKDSQEKSDSLAFNVFLDLQGGRLGDEEDETTTKQANLYDLPTPIRDGYIFTGWWMNPSYSGAKVLPSEMRALKPNQMLYAKWYGPIQIGGIGPAGGYVFYDKGSYSDGWRYLEAAPVGNEYTGKVWGGYNIAVGGTGTAIGTGESNTEKIVAKFGIAEPYGKKTDYAAKLCADLVVTKDGVVYDDWFLPSKDELNLVYENLKKNNLGGFSEDNCWSSSEANAGIAWIQDFGSGTQHVSSYRSYFLRVRPVRAF